MRSNFDASLAAVLVHEGGFVNDPRDPGGATMKGVTQRTYDLWRVDHQLPRRSVKHLTPAEICAIYKSRFWDRVCGDQLPGGLDYCVFDFAVNSGVDRASRYLQETVGAEVDGKIGPATMLIINELDADSIAGPTDAIDHICDMRQHFLEGLRTFGRFGRGWTARVKQVRAKAKGMAA